MPFSDYALRLDLRLPGGGAAEKEKLLTSI